MNIKRILVPVDFSEFSKEALEHASRWAERFDARMTLAHVVVLHAEEFDEAKELRKLEIHAEEKEKERANLLHEHRALLDHPEEMIDSVLLRGFSAGGALLDYMSERDFDLVIMATHGYTGVKKWLYGSVAEEIVRFSPVPVLTIQKDTGRFPLTRILVPVDFSEHSKSALSTAKALANIFGAELDVLHVVELGTLPAIEDVHIFGGTNQFEDVRHHIMKTLMSFAAVDDDGASFAIEEGRACEEIPHHAEKNNVDLIVMAAKGQSNLEHFLVGSTAERVVGLAPCPVLTVGRDTSHRRE